MSEDEDDELAGLHVAEADEAESELHSNQQVDISRIQPLPGLGVHGLVMKQLIAGHFSSPRTKISQEAVQLSSGLIRCFALEALHRAAAEAESVGAPEVLCEHLEKVLPQLLLDFNP
mmetsp:Transcript_26197/g.43357  ORF Transcript_26197/g.43357 Transcript_26197/m.43357 type:complete len:117 (+) Transcript_26197:36-386(+)